MSSKRKAPRPVRPQDHPAWLGKRAAAPLGAIRWTPLEMACSCVIDLGWGGPGTADPGSFMRFCVRVLPSNCLWHGADTGIPASIPGDQVVQLANGPGGNDFIYYRRARGADIRLGQRLTREITRVMDLAAMDGPAGLVSIAPHYARWLRSKGEDPAAAILDGRLTDLILNRGAVDTLTGINAHLAARDKES